MSHFRPAAAALAAVLLATSLNSCIVTANPHLAASPGAFLSRTTCQHVRWEGRRRCPPMVPSPTCTNPSPRTAASSTRHLLLPPPLSLARCDNLLSGLAEISMGTSLGTLWSELAIISTGCGPVNFSDSLERLCYQGVIVSAGLSIFTRIATGKDLVAFSQENIGYLDGLQDGTLWQVRVAEWLSLLAVLGAFVALGFQIYNGENMDGLSGIDVEMCRAIRDL